ncbi:LysM peptidoglycan-binding domain-containing protein, partial [Streptomyces spectabilis]|uniref:LysM peptidoglycan-binding domain-containing protein n=1 Tax=Streptomyces spectabilis TaxID=68270 RepID=UPI0033E43323
MLGLAAEIPQSLRRRPARRHRRLGAPQRLAGFLLGGLLILPASAAVASPASTVTATAPQRPSHDLGTPPSTPAPGERTADSTATPNPPPGPVHVVGDTGETVWDLAVTYLGSGPRAQEIRRLNPGLPQGPLLPPGLEIRLPSDARRPDPGALQLTAEKKPLSSPSPPDPAAARTERTHTVRPGESLSRIAEQETGDASAWPRLYDATRNRRQPDGAPRLRDPDLIYPGQKITIPGTAGPPPGSSPEDDGEHQLPRQPSEGPDKDGARDGQGQSSALPEHRERQPPAPADPERDPPPPAPSTPAPAPAHEPGSSPALFTTVRTTGVLASLAAAVTLALAIRRILQRRRARPGQRIAMPPEPSATEAQLAQDADDPRGLARRPGVRSRRRGPEALQGHHE